MARWRVWGWNIKCNRRYVATLMIGVAVALFINGRCNLVRADSSPAATQPASVLDFTLKDIDGHDAPLSQYKGKVLLIVNVASLCGNTPQYAGLEKLYQQDEDRGLVVLGFPANNFRKQEPGSDGQIKEFCSTKYHVTFPMFSKISVKGSDIAPLYSFLTRQETQPQPSGDITWNFEKFVVGRDGKVVARYKPKTQPDDAELVKTIDSELGKTKH
jgi:glutathione peroxidase